MRQTQAQKDLAYEQTQARHKKEAEDSLIRAAMSALGRRGGKKTSKKKVAASKKSLAKAREKRWPKKATVNHST